MLDKVKPAAIGARPASVFVNFWQPDGAEDNPSQLSQQAIRADLIGSDTAVALGLIINSSSPVLALCRALVEAGHDPAIPLEAYRGNVLCLRVRSIGEASNSTATGPALGMSTKGAEPHRCVFPREVEREPPPRCACA
jgi:hypothetical protein